MLPMRRRPNMLYRIVSLLIVGVITGILVGLIVGVFTLMLML